MVISKSKITERQKKVLRELIEFTCEGCHKKEATVGTLQVHRINRGNNGGTYTLRNIKMLCRKCHKKYHENDFSHVRSK